MWVLFIKALYSDGVTQYMVNATSFSHKHLINEMSNKVVSHLVITFVPCYEKKAILGANLNV